MIFNISHYTAIKLSIYQPINFLMILLTFFIAQYFSCSLKYLSCCRLIAYLINIINTKTLFKKDQSYSIANDLLLFFSFFNFHCYNCIAKLTKKAEAALEYAQYRKKMYNDHFKNASDNFIDPDVIRKIKLLKDMGTAALEDADFNLLTATRTNMSGIYNSAKICPYEKQNCSLETEGWTLDPDIELKLASSNDFDEMKYIWVSLKISSQKI